MHHGQDSNVHLHTIVLDGVYVSERGEPPSSPFDLSLPQPLRGAPIRFRKLPPPSNRDLRRILLRVRNRLLKLLASRGHVFNLNAMDGLVADPLDQPEEPTLFDALQAASVREWSVLTSPGTRPVRVLGREKDVEWDDTEKPFCARLRGGFTLQAGVRIRAGDREGLERLCKYIVRPPFSEERLELLEDGRVLYRFRRPRPDGSTHIVLTGVEFLEKLAALIPPPRHHLTRYHGVLAPHAAARSRVVPRSGGDAVSDCERRHPAREAQRDFNMQAPSRRPWIPRRRRTPWAELLKRSMAIDALECPKCHGRMKLIAMIRRRQTVCKILEAMGLPTDAPALEPARPPPGHPESGLPLTQGRLDFEFAQRRGDDLDVA